MGRIKATAQHVWQQPVKVRVAVIILLTFILAIVVQLVVAAILEFGFLGLLTMFGVLAFFLGLLWAAITVATSDL